MFYESGIGWSLGTILSSVLETLNISKYQDFDGIADPAAPSVNGVRIYSKMLLEECFLNGKVPLELTLLSSCFV
jgi:hypothetical protein